MKIFCVFDEGEYYFYPDDAWEREEIYRVFYRPVWEEKTRLTYRGRGVEGKGDDRRTILKFNIGGYDFQLIGSSPEDDEKIRELRRMLFGGPGGCLYFLGMKEIDNELVPAIAAAFCSACGRPMIGYGAVWGICDDCAGLCTHDWVEGLVVVYHYHLRMSTGMGIFCAKCGRAKPDKEGYGEGIFPFGEWMMHHLAEALKKNPRSHAVILSDR